MAEIDELARRAVATVTLLADRAAKVATGVAVLVGAIAVVVFLIGLAALDGAARSVWVVIGLALMIVAAGAPLLARWRLKSVQRSATELVADVRTLIDRNAEARRVVIDTVEQPAPEGSRSTAVVVDGRRFTNLRTVAGTANDLRSLPSAMVAVTTFPFLLFVSLALLPVFFVLGVVFLIAWVV